MGLKRETLAIESVGEEVGTGSRAKKTPAKTTQEVRGISHGRSHPAFKQAREL